MLIRLWSLIFIDFVIKLPPLKELLINVVFDLIIIIVNKLIKNIIFNLFKEASNADRFIYIFLWNVITEHTLLKKLVIDRNKLFISKF